LRLITHPVLCNYYLTYRCNATCHFCDIWEKPSPYIQLEDAKSNFEQLKKLGVKVIDFTGGEPLLHQKLPDLLDLARQSGFITTVTTNTLLYPKMAKRLTGLVDMLHFSLDYYDREKHDAARGVPCYDFVIRSIELALSLGERPDILMTVFEDNLSEIKDIYEKIALKNDLVLILNPSFDYQDVQTHAVQSENLDQLSQWAHRPGIYLNEAFIELRKSGGNQISDPVCRAASSTVVISPENELVVPCYHLGIRRFKIDNNLYDLYKSTEVQQEVAKEGRLPACQGCTINCYMQPSFAVEINRFFWRALPSTLKYNLMKKTYRSLFRRSVA
jgi:MoaA/NifB/PqqE/SkfB family radical SAM enzyme